MPASPLIQIRQLRKAYREGDEIRWIFEQLDLDVQCGEFVALVGRSGSGKSTLLNLVSGIDLPDAGLLRVDGHVLTALNETERTRFRRSRLGFVFQFFNLIPTLTVEENVLLPLELNGLKNLEYCRRAFYLLERVGLSDRRRSFPERLSGGEQQRLAIVRALVHQPSLLLADEPTGNLDAETSARIMEILLELPRQANTTVLMVTHSRELANQVDRLLYLKSGQVQEIAS
jgi:putative ABC transport system ATP-binding protein